VAQARAALGRGRRLAIALLASALCAYGYGPEQDPFVAAWKRVAADANQGRWAEADAAARELEPGLAELEAGLGWKPRVPLRTSLEARDARALARELTAAACAAVLWKLEASRRAGLEDYYAAKYRVEAARSTYLELLAPTVRARGAAHHERVLAALAAAQAALGRPGFLGRGVRPADAAAFAAAERELETALRSVFPFAPEVPK
jgi:hypothetical protein